MKRDPYRWTWAELRRRLKAGKIPTPCDRETISRLPVVTIENPLPLPMKTVARFVPGYDPWRDADGFTFDVERAEDAVSFFHECIRHQKGELRGTPLVLQLWQQAVIANAFGWVDEDGFRRYRAVHEYTPRKQGKTTKVAGLGCKLLFADGELGAEVYSAAADRIQSALTFDQMQGMVTMEPELDSRGVIFQTFKSIEVEETGSIYRALSSKSETKDGLNAHGILFDEIHAQKNRKLWDVLDTSTGSRRQPLSWTITTAGPAGPTIGNERLAFALKVRNGVIRASYFLPVVYRAEKGEDWKSEKTWRLANPNYGISLRPDYIEKKCDAARSNPAELNTFKRLHLNITTQSNVAAINLDAWDRCNAGPKLFDRLKGHRCYLGLDLASTEDLAALAAYFPDLGVTVERYFLPMETAKVALEKRGVPFLEWGEDPHARLELTEGNVIDYGFVRRAVHEWAEQFRVITCAYDRWNASQIVNELVDDGVDMMPFGQGYASMSGPTKQELAAVASGEEIHDGNPVTRWCASNLMTKEDPAGNIKPDKAKSGEKIDGMVARIMARGAAILKPDDDEGPSVLEDREPIVA